MKRIIRDRRLTPEEAAKYKAVREQVAQELPELVARHHENITQASFGEMQAILGSYQNNRPPKEKD